MKEIKELIRVEMATNEAIYSMSFGDTYHIEQQVDGWFAFINQNNEIINEYPSKEEAEESMIKWAIDSQLIITGYGKNSGRKFWQLPELLQQEIISKAINE